MDYELRKYSFSFGHEIILAVKYIDIGTIAFVIILSSICQIVFNFFALQKVG